MKALDKRRTANGFINVYHVLHSGISLCRHRGYLVPGRVPGGFLTSVIFGILGAWVGGSLVGNIGPAFFGVAILPAILGSAILVFMVSLITRKTA